MNNNDNINDSTINLITDLSANLIEALLLNLSVPSYNLTKEQFTYINEFINICPDTLNILVNDINNITEDGKIDVHDIPVIIHLIADLYNTTTLTFKNTNVTKENIIAFIKFTIHVILNSKLVILPEVEKQIIEKLINSSINLLVINLGNIKNTKNTCNGIFSFFKFC